MKAILSVDDGKAYLQNADTNAYLEARFENIDVSGPIEDHNGSPTAHSDIRAAVSDAATVARNAASAAAEAQRTADGKAAASHTHTKSQIADFPSSMPASDVYSWAKAATKPTYTASEVGAAESSHNHDASAITSGTLPVARGGTGATSISALATSLGAARIAYGSYRGTGQDYTNDKYKRSLTFNFTPQMLIIWDKQSHGYSGAGRNFNIIDGRVSSDYFASSAWSSQFGIFTPITNKDSSSSTTYQWSVAHNTLYITFGTNSITWYVNGNSESDMYNEYSKTYGYIVFG